MQKLTQTLIISLVWGGGDGYLTSVLSKTHDNKTFLMNNGATYTSYAPDEMS